MKLQATHYSILKSSFNPPDWRWMVLLLLFIIPQEGHGQKKLRGEYSYFGNMEKTIITFEGKDSFKYLNKGEFWSESGQGIYQINLDSLILTFQVRDYIYQKFDIKQRSSIVGDSVKIELFVFDSLTKERIQNAEAIFTELFKDSIINTHTDITGFVSFKVKKAKIGFWHCIIRKEFKECDFPLFPNKSTEFICATDEHTIPSGTVWRYKIKKRTVGKLVLQQADDVRLYENPQLIKKTYRRIRGWTYYLVYPSIREHSNKCSDTK